MIYILKYAVLNFNDKALMTNEIDIFKPCIINATTPLHKLPSTSAPICIPHHGIVYISASTFRQPSKLRHLIFLPFHVKVSLL